MSYCPRLHRAARIVRDGGVIAYPTEAVFGLGCDPANEAAVRRIIAIKGRSTRAGLILIADCESRLHGWIAPGAGGRLTAIEDKPITWVVPAGPRANPLVTGGRRSVAVRVTRHAIAAALCRAAGRPLVSTSANFHGRPPARSALAVHRQLGELVDYVLAGATGGARRPSEIRDARTGAVLRRG